MKNSTPVSANMVQLQVRAKELRLAGLLAHWDTLVCDPARVGWVTELLGWEETERDQRSLERRLRASHIGKFKPLADYEWDWPRHCDRQAIQELMTLSFMADASNVMLVGPKGGGQVHAGVQSGPTGLDSMPHRAVHHCRAIAGRAGGTGQ